MAKKIITAIIICLAAAITFAACSGNIKNSDFKEDHPSILRGYEKSDGDIGFYSRMAAYEMDRPGNVVVRVDIKGTFDKADVSYRAIPSKQVRYKNGKLIIDKDFFKVFQSPIDRVLNVFTKEGGTASIPLSVVNKVITTTEEFSAINDNVESLNGYYVLGADLDFSGINDFEMIGLKTDEFGNEEEWSFTGTFDGGGHTISNLTVSRGYDGSTGNEKGYIVGLFKRISGTGVVRNLKLSGFDITAIGIGGALAGINEGTISNCIVTDSAVTSKGVNEPSGALAGFNATRAVIKDCIAQVKDVNAFTIAGGNFGAINNCRGVPLEGSSIPRVGGYIRVGVEDWQPEGFLVENDYFVNMGEGTGQNSLTLDIADCKQMSYFTDFNGFVWKKQDGSGITLRKLFINN